MNKAERREVLTRNAKAILEWVEQNVPSNLKASIKYNRGFVYGWSEDYISIDIADGKASIITNHSSGRRIGMSADGKVTHYDDYDHHPDKDVTDSWWTNFNWYELTEFTTALEYTCNNWQSIKRQIMDKVEQECNLINFTV